MPVTTQAVDLPTLIASTQRALTLSLAGAGITSPVRFWVSDERPRYDSSGIVCFRLTTQTGVAFSGAGRRGHLANQTLEIFAHTRYVVDQAGSDLQLATATGIGFYRTLLACLDAFQDLNIFSAYKDTWTPNDGTAGIPNTAVPLTRRPCQLTEFTVPYKPRAKEDQGWIAGKIAFDLLLVQPLSL